MSVIAGVTFVKIDGNQIPLSGTATISFGAAERESKVGPDGYHGVKEMPAADSIEMECQDHQDLDLNALAKMTGVTITVELINGKVATLRNANQMLKPELDPTEGNFSLRFEGPKGEWLVA